MKKSTRQLAKEYQQQLLREDEEFLADMLKKYYGCDDKEIAKILKNQRKK